MEKVTGGLAAHYQSICSRRLRHVDKVPDGDRGVCVGVYQEGGLDVLDIPQGHTLPDSYLSGTSAVSSVLSRGMCLPVPCPVFRSVHGPTSVHQSFRSDFRVGAPEGRVPPSLSG